MNQRHQYALISVYKKDGVVDLVKTLLKYDYQIISTGGTAHLLKQNNISVIEVSDLTGVQELLGGRVKTLNHKIHAGILSRRTENERDELKTLGINLIDLVVTNLYPFEEGLQKNLPLEEMIELIDIGGPTMIRAAAKNFAHVGVLTHPNQYPSIMSELNENQGILNEETKRSLAQQAFSLTAHYDSIIHHYLTSFHHEPNNMLDPMTLILNKRKDLRYGENPHQKAAFYSTKEGEGLPFKILHGKELSYNNIVDISSALSLLSNFQKPCAVIIKHNNPCGAALDQNIFDAFQNALNCDPISAFGGVVGLNETIDKRTAKILTEIFLEVVIAPKFTEEALAILSQKKNLRLVEYDTPFMSEGLTFKAVHGGFLVQTPDEMDCMVEDLKCVTDRKPTESELEDMLFAWKIVKNTTSNSIVIVKDQKTVGLGIGQTSRIGAVEIALNQACDQTKGAVLASDGFFPAVDNIYAAQQSRISAIIQPGGSIKDKDVILASNKASISMMLTGYRHFKH